MLGHILLPGSLGMEETMERRWRVRRDALERPDARQHWEQAYQSILRWSLENEQAHAPSANGKEEYHESGGVRSRVSTSRQVKLQTIEQQLEMVCKYARQKGWDLPEEDFLQMQLK
jgi:hypothetical protein